MLDYPEKSPIFYRDMTRGYPIMDRGEGVYIFDEQGNRYLDAAGGIAVVNIGHGVGEIAEAAARQARRLAFAYSGTGTSRPQMDLAKKLAAMAPKGMGEVKVFFCCGGSEATETALKLARQYYLAKGQGGKYKFVSRWQGYHGNTIGALSITGRTQWREPFLPLLLGFPHICAPICYRCPLGKTYPECGVQCAWELERVLELEGAEAIAGFMAEPIIGTSATAVAPPPEYYSIIRSICDEHDILMVSDEVITGLGRTGKNFGIDHWDVAPDIITTGKALSGGYAPLAAVIVSEKVWRTFWEKSEVFYHGHTYVGHTLSCAIGDAVQGYIQKHNLIQRSVEMGERLLKKLQGLLDLPYVGEVRGKGMLLGVELVKDKETKEPFSRETGFADQIAHRAMELGVIVIPGVQGTAPGLAGDHLQISPPFIFDEEDGALLTEVLRRAILEIGEDLTG